VSRLTNLVRNYTSQRTDAAPAKQSEGGEVRRSLAALVLGAQISLLALERQSLLAG
jgi:hypothetical protein